MQYGVCKCFHEQQGWDYSCLHPWLTAATWSKRRQNSPFSSQQLPWRGVHTPPPPTSWALTSRTDHPLRMRTDIPTTAPKWMLVLFYSHDQPVDDD